MQPTGAIDFVFFDIGGTLGDRDPQSGNLIAFPSTASLLAVTRDVLKLRIGVITTLGTMTDDEGRSLLAGAGLDRFLDPKGFVSEHNGEHVAKPQPQIYQIAARQVGVPIERCLFIGENLLEVIGAVTAGMRAILKPCPPGRDSPV